MKIPTTYRLHLMLLCLLSMAFFKDISAQAITARASVDTSQALIGDQLHLSLVIQKSPEILVEFPDVRESFSEKMELLSISDIDSVRLRDGFQLIEQELVFAVFDTGIFEIPAMSFRFHVGDIVDSIFTRPVTVEVLPLALDEDIRDIKSIARAPLTFREMYPFILAAFVIITAFWLARSYYRRKYMTIPVAEDNPLMDPPDRIAIEALEKLRKEEPWLNQPVKDYYVRLTEILRIYIEQQFTISALELTSEEILQALKLTRCNSKSLPFLMDLLTLGDMVKFAKVIPTNDENAEQIDLAISFVRKSKAGIMLSNLEPAEAEPQVIKVIGNK